MKKMKEDIFIRILSGYYGVLGSIVDLSGRSVELDLGCGKGGFSTQLAKKHTDRLILSADVMIGRLRKLVKRNQRENVENIEPLRAEARQLVSYMLPDSSLRRMHMLCPDPWPKTRHKANRLLCSDFLGQIHRVLDLGGVFHFASDDDYYFDAVEQLFKNSGIFSRDDSTLDDISDLKTDFENRWLEEGRTVRHMAWVKSTAPPKVQGAVAATK